MKLLGLITLTLLISCGKNEPLTQAGKLAEGISQVPRKVGNELLGVDSSTENDLKDEVKRIDGELDRMQGEIEALKADISRQFFDLTLDLGEASRELREQDTALLEALQDTHTDLADQIADLEAVSLDQIIDLQHNIIDLADAIIFVNDRVNNLEVICDYLNMGVVHFVTYCKLDESDCERDLDDNNKCVE